MTREDILIVIVLSLFAALFIYLGIKNLRDPNFTYGTHAAELLGKQRKPISESQNKYRKIIGTIQLVVGIVAAAIALVMVTMLMIGILRNMFV